MTNEEAICLIGNIQFDLTDGYYQREDYIEALCVFDRLIQENTNLKAEIEQGRLDCIEEYQQRLIRYIDTGKHRSADKKVFSENDVVYLIEHGVFPCEGIKTIAETEICKMRREYGLPCSGCVYSDTCEKKQKENDCDK